MFTPSDADTNALESIPQNSEQNDSQLTISPTYRKKYRSKSAVSNDPRSPYYTSQGIQGIPFQTRFSKAQSVSCVPDYDGSRYARVAGRACPLNGGIPGLNLSPDDPKAATIRQHYYPEGGWGWVICVCAVLVEIISTGLHTTFGLLIIIIQKNFGKEATLVQTVFVGSLSMSVSLFLSPVVVAICRRKSTRLMAVLGGLVTALGCLFTSFASQFHQLFFSYGVFIGGGVSLTKETSDIIVGQYFKKKRELVEIFVICGIGVAIAAMPLFITQCIKILGWRFGLQTVTGVVSITFVLGIFYRPASLYHPQRRAILHLKGLQKRSKAKDKNTTKEKPPFFDFGVLKSRTVQILISGCAVSAFGINAPLMLLVYQGRKEGLDQHSSLLLQTFFGMASTLGSAAFGFIVVKNSLQCMIARQYLNQASCFMLAGCLLAFVSFDDYHGYVLFVWIYGFFYGGYQYSLKMFTFEKVRARNFAKAWSFIQCSQAIPTAVGFPLTSYLNERFGDKKGFYFSSACIFCGFLVLFLIDIHKRNVRRQKTMSTKDDPTKRSPKGIMDNGPNYSRRSSFQDATDPYALRVSTMSKQQALQGRIASFSELRRQELTCISEEAMMDNYLDDFVDDCITSCNKEEKYLMLSEFENNLNNTHEVFTGSRRDKRTGQTRKISVVTPPLLEHCPNCLRIVPIDGDTQCAVFSCSKDSPQIKSSKTADVIKDITSSL